MPGERGRYRLEFIVPRDAAGLNFAYANTTNDVLPYDLEYVPFVKLFYPERKDGLDVVQTVAAANVDMVILMANVSVALNKLQRRLPGVQPAEMQVALCPLGKKSWSKRAPNRMKGERHPQIARVAAGIASERIFIRISQVRNAQAPDRKHWGYTDLGLLPLKLTVTNRGIESYRLATSEFCLVHSAGFAFKDAGLWQHDAMLGEWNTLVEVPPGKTITFPMVFWAPKDPGELWIRFEESSLNRDGPGTAIYNCHLPPEALQSIVYFEED